MTDLITATICDKLRSLNYKARISTISTIYTGRIVVVSGSYHYIISFTPFNIIVNAGATTIAEIDYEDQEMFNKIETSIKNHANPYVQ